MHFSVLANAAFASSALSVPSLASAIAPRQKGACLTRAEAKDIVDIYVQLIANYTDGHQHLYLHASRGTDLCNRGDLMSAQNANPPFPVVVDSIDAIDCEAVALHWHTTFGAANLPSKGIKVTGTAKREGYEQINSLDVEFDGLIWLLNMSGNYIWEG
ncbi:hypothetical protein B0T13DRAFT_511646 [Neurospora crassa]|nr:hypothetical protein B0T13DRAFT_511646 [Neurospora crassa]